MAEFYNLLGYLASVKYQRLLTCWKRVCLIILSRRILEILLRSSFNPLRDHKMVKHTQTIRRLLPTNCVIVFGHFVGLGLKGLSHTQLKAGRYEYLILIWKFEFLFIILEVKFLSVLGRNTYRFFSSFWVRVKLVITSFYLGDWLTRILELLIHPEGKPLLRVMSVLGASNLAAVNNFRLNCSHW